MSKPIAVVASDTHGEPRAWARHPGIAGDSYFAMQQIRDYCWEHHLPLILAGDVFDKAYPDPYTVSVFVNLLTSLRERDLGVYYIQGQHEYSATRPWLALVPGAWHIHKHQFYLPFGRYPGAKIYGLDFTHAADLADALDDIPADTDILVAHQVWEEHMGKHASPEGSLKDVPHVKMVITGDFHGHKVTNVKSRDDKRTIKVVSPGSTCLQSIDEDPDKYFFVLHDDLTVHSVALKCRRAVKYRVHTQQQLDDLVEKDLRGLMPFRGELPETIATPIARVEYLDSLPEAEDRIKAAAGNRCHLFLTPIGTKKAEEKKEAQPSNEGPRGLEWHLRGMKDTDPAKYATSLRLWKATDIKAEVEAVIADAMRDESHSLWSTTRGANEEPPCD